MSKKQVLRPNLTDEELIKRSKDWITKLCNSSGKDWCLHVPVNPERDPDMLFNELIRRYRENIRRNKNVK